MNLKDFIRSIPDYPKKGILFRDITTLIKNEKAFSETINQIVERSKKVKFDKIAAIVSRGFVFASAVSYILKKPFVMLRKKNKLPADVHSIDFELEYGTATIEVHKDSIDENDEVLIIDDLIATGGTAEAAAKLVEVSKGKVAAFIFVINLFDLNGTDKLLKKGYIVHGLKRRSSSFNTSRIDHLYQDPHEISPQLILHYGDLVDSTNIIRLIKEIEPDEIYNLAAQSHVAVSFETPEYTANCDALGTLRILEAVKLLKLELKTKIFQNQILNGLIYSCLL